MPRLNEISEESMQVRKQILEICNTPTIVDDICKATKRTKNRIMFSIRELLKAGSIKVEGSQRNKNSRQCFAYLTTNQNYTPYVKENKPVVIAIHVPELPKPFEYKPKIVHLANNKRVIYQTDYVRTAGTKEKRSAWTGSTLGTSIF